MSRLIKSDSQKALVGASEDSMIGLGIFTAIAGCACIFLVYALAAFWREWRTSRRRRDARVVGLHLARRLNRAQGKLLFMRRTDLIQRAERSTAGRR